MSDQALLIVRKIDVFYGSLRVLLDVSLEVFPREMVAVIGANGAGKSSLLGSISGLLHPAKGEVIFNGKDITFQDPFKIVGMGISLVPEGRRIFPDMTVFENLRIGSYNRKARANLARNLEVVYGHFPILEKRKKQLARTLSGGEQQMLAIGRGLMSEPRLILLDEMSLGLGPVVINELYEALKKIRLQGITIVFVEQNVRRTLKEADRAYILENGRITLSGHVAELKEEERVKKAYFGT